MHEIVGIRAACALLRRGMPVERVGRTLVDDLGLTLAQAREAVEAAADLRARGWLVP